MAQQQSGSIKKHSKAQFKDLRRRVRKVNKAIRALEAVTTLYSVATLTRIMKGRKYEKLSDFGVDCDILWDTLHNPTSLLKAIENLTHSAKVECDAQDIRSGILAKPRKLDISKRGKKVLKKVAKQVEKKAAEHASKS